MDLNKLRYFLVVAETEHVTRAANMLGISQPALTRAIHRLEEEMGVTLMMGEGRNIRLTEEGLFLKQHAAQAMRTLDEAEKCSEGILSAVAADDRGLHRERFCGGGGCDRAVFARAP